MTGGSFATDACTSTSEGDADLVAFKARIAARFQVELRAQPKHLLKGEHHCTEYDCQCKFEVITRRQ